MKKIILFLLIITLFSCNKKTEALSQEIKTLRHMNDSLTKITNSLKDKYIFDEVRVKVVPSEKNNYKLNSTYEGTFLIIAYNESDSVYFSTKMDSTNGLNLLNPKLLKRDFEGYHFNFKMKELENNIHFNIKMNNKIGKNLDGLMISDKKNVQ
ncbi:hypothetical protein IUY40_00805 [Flavobacterium sp. ALJ2]|uniref:hypothetical protein n=1 Tax=Flavobacterium sp. ALJ2 TaxID=2786960 RepID=UPI00189F42D1|nr:hypothetical protein [Flavobacterium sp. ALJ2]MBF7090082.1 hypothetical protein [Flavobacterium sp. ALJ2]